jgi:hypothetical protein
VRFADSHTQAWTGALQIWRQGSNHCAHIYFGTNAQGLSAEQLDQVQFMINGQNGPTNFAAVLLPTGELVPQGPPPMCYTNCGNTLVLSWPGGYELLTATNPGGPYEPVPAAASPFTNTLNERQRFFRLHLPGQ